MTSLRDRIRERRLAQWGLTYVAGAFVAIQVMESLEEPMGLSVGLQQSILVVIVMGLLVALTLAWFHGDQGAQTIRLLEVGILGGLGLSTMLALWSLPDREAAATPTFLTTTIGPRPGAEGISIAVLPLVELTPPIEQLRIPEAVHDQILTHLAQVPSLHPKSRTSVIALADLSLTTRQIADTLGADYVLEATLQHVAPVVRVNAQLIDPLSDEHVWAEIREFQVTDFFTLQEQVADWVTVGVQVALGVSATETVHARNTMQAAYQLYLDGRTFAHSRKQADLASAIDAYLGATELDPDFAPALSSLALAYALWGHYGYGGAYASYETFGRALFLVERAIELEPGLATAHAVRGYLLSKALAPAELVRAAFTRALELAPSSSDARILYAGFLAREGRFAESLQQSQRAIDLDPIAPGRDSGLGYNALAAGDIELALNAAQRASVLQPDLLAPRIIQAFALVLSSRSEDCVDLDLGSYEAVRAICLHSSGEAQEAASLIRDVMETEGPRNARLHVASYLAWIGDARGAAEALGQAYEDSPHGLDYRVIASGIFDPVRDDAALRAELERIETEVWERAQSARTAASVSG